MKAKNLTPGAMIYNPTTGHFEIVKTVDVRVNYVFVETEDDSSFIFSPDYDVSNDRPFFLALAVIILALSLLSGLLFGTLQGWL